MRTPAVAFALLIVLGQTTCSFGTNIARGGQVTQSSLYGNAVPERAIDGNHASIWSAGSCTHTQNDHKPWWRLDLLKMYKINTVTITNRKDCCHQRLNGAEIRIGNSLNDNGNANPRCAVISSIGAGTSETFVCNGMEGRYINIVIPGRKEYLTLCEVEVTGQPSGTNIANIARGGQVTQSSLYGNAVPERAIDGNHASMWSAGSCTHTQNDHKPWWRLDLLEIYKINTVTITNRKDCCHQRLDGAEIRIGNSLNDNGNANPRCAVISSIGAGTSETFVCNGMEGRYINIVIPGRKEYLTLCEVEVTGQPSGTKIANIARGGQVTQSSLYGNAVPERAIDGNHASMWSAGSCTHTQNDHKPWWRLDLLEIYKINTVTITNRKDCCHQRLDGAEIRIGNSLNDNGNANPRCAVISSIGAGTSETFVCNGMEGRYINIVIPGRKEYLTLCEVEVTGQPSGTNIANIARGGQVTQSSLYGNAVPERAIDGNHASMWSAGSCTHTQNDHKPWWRLDLLEIYKINTVTITNRKDCCHQRLDGAEIRIGNFLNDNGNANPRCAVISSIAAGTSETFVCNGMEGRYINIVIPGRKEYLTLCEVEVTGQPSGTKIANIARGGQVTQSSLYGNAVPERAIDGNHASMWSAGSCTHTQNDHKPWWRLDLLKMYKINTVTITNRKDCCHQRLDGAEIHIGNSLNDNGNANPRCAVISSIGAGTSETFVCNGMEGRYINIVIPGRKEYLTLCEVEVSGTESDDLPEYSCN
ncbi:uncharacterized protein LOC108889124 isoform X10 [Lates calcarifer]|uniref:Uncharacterized protein LOC108889124 isoform X10 n=1 Tax=Lates calcarifer TaxID=8187 RepID=A0AAJ8BI87_LATCA|nr:uncharacterized protein LOC108889124 isoform X4 [Lates calcarifer]XP_050932138.1 uncharacterized protein LOC108889124 isoform X5 [Lates calcarifer]XP_050932139.1 uncharacterized protein LOC108889124 isoform X6 [Lates calcarifer]XP_050932143.1 uncharacterized protein LOC108889124 isoform X10 [Lates calcarifer]